MDCLTVLREQAYFELLGKADDETKAGRHHVARSELMMAEAALAGKIDTGQTIQTLLNNLLIERKN
jgi:hypothetical protein